MSTSSPASEAAPPVVRVADLAAHVGGSVRVQGWLANRRSSGGLHFLQVRDGSGTVQAVVGKKDVAPETFTALDHVTQESALVLDGELRADKRSPGGVELGVRAARIVSLAEPYPISNKEHSTGFLMEHRHLWLRSGRQAATLRVRARIIKSIRDFFDSRGFTCMDAPIFTPSACEGTQTLFSVDYFEEKAFLSQSGQLYGEAGAMALGKIYVFGPTFRAEKSKTRRHLTEFWMIEPEVAFLELDGLLDLIEEYLETIVQDVLRDCRPELTTLERDLSRLERIRRPFPRTSYSDAVALMNAEGHPFAWGGDLGAPDEDFLSAREEKPLLIHRYPASVKAFYMKRDPRDERVALCVDVIAPEGYGELIGGSQRADDLAFLEDQIRQHQLPREAYEWYLDLRRYGSVPHAGFGMGLERMVAWMCGTAHIRECIPFPRTIYKIYP